MDLLGMLRKLGDRFGIIELKPDSQHPSVPMKIQTRTITLTELTIQIGEMREIADLPAELPVSFEDIFKSAGIPAPPAGWTVDRLQEFLNSEPIRGMDRAEAQRETISMLAAEKVDSAEIIKDAILRDQTLDAFEDLMAKKRNQWQMEKKQQIEALKQEIAAEEKKWNDWRRQKRQYEQNMARAVGYLIDRPVISIEEE